MTSLFSVIAHEDANDQGKLRQAAALSAQRVEDRFGAFVRKGSVDDQSARFSLVEEDVRAVVAAACEQVGIPVGGIYDAIAKNFVTADATPQLRTAGVRHEARKPKMCPYHSEVTDISLAQGEAQAGYNAMAQHAWGANHCQGEGYKGDRCKFKPEMTTQSYWDGRAEKLEQKRQERAEREEQLQQEQQVTELPEIETPAEVPDNTDAPVATEQTDIVEHNEPSAVGEGAEVPMAMAAKTADAGPVPKMDKSKWTPKTVSEPDYDDDDTPWPTRRKDVTQPIAEAQGSRFEPSKLKEIGEQVTEHQDVTEKGGIDRPADQGGTFGGGEKSAVSSLLSQDAVREALSKIKRG